MRKYLRIYKESIKIAFAGALAYRFDFILSTFVTLIGNILFPLVTILIYSSGASFPDWSLYEVLLIQSIFTISTGIASMLFNGVLWATMRSVIEGNLEIVLIKPVDCLFYLIASTFEFDSMGLVLGGGIIFGIAVSHIGSITFMKVLQFILLFICGVLVMMGISLIMGASSFRWVGNSRIPEIFESIKSFGKYPQNIFSRTVSGLAAFAIPVAMIGYFPAAALLGKTSLGTFIAIIPCVLFALGGILLYKHMVHLYEGVGG